MFVSDPSLKAAGEAADTFPHMHGTLRSYACTYCSAFRLAHPPLLCQPWHIETQPLVQDTLSVLGTRCTGLFESYFLLGPEPLTNSKQATAGAVFPRDIEMS